MYPLNVRRRKRKERSAVVHHLEAADCSSEEESTAWHQRMIRRKYNPLHNIYEKFMKRKERLLRLAESGDETAQQYWIHAHNHKGDAKLFVWIFLPDKAITNKKMRFSKKILSKLPFHKTCYL